MAGIFKLPLEIRRKIYFYAIPQGRWSIVDDDELQYDRLPRGVGDIGGFFYPLSKDVEVLQVCKQMRHEALPLAYQMTAFDLGDLDDVIKLLLAIGSCGRDNIESLRFSWESKSDPNCSWENVSDPDKAYLTPPTQNVPNCVLLLKACRRLRHLGICFSKELVTNMRAEDFFDNSGIKSLCSLKSTAKLEIYDQLDFSLEHLELVTTMKRMILDVSK